MDLAKTTNIILFQGDSITDAGRNRIAAGPISGKDLGFGYARMVADQLKADNQDLQFYNRGVSGDQLRGMASRWEFDAVKLQPDLISILIGVNDTWNYMFTGMGSSPEEYRIVYQDLLNNTLARLPGVQLVLCEPFILINGEVTRQWEEDLALRRAAVQDLAREFGGIHVPFQSALNKKALHTPPVKLLDDGVHPTALGHKILADCWLKYVLGKQI